MRFSIVIPTFREENTITSCVDAIRRQHLNPALFEIIVSDAGSDDRTEELARAAGARMVRTSERGIAHGRNMGASAANGEILVFVDADVRLDPEFLSEIDRSMAERTVVCVTGVPRPGDGGFWRRSVYRATFVLVRVFHFFGVEFFPGLCVAYRKTIFVTMKGFREDLGIVEDLDLSTRVSAFGKCVVNPRATGLVSTRRLERHGLSTVLFHIVNDVRYLLTGRAARFYPKTEDVGTWKDLWKSFRWYEGSTKSIHSASVQK